MFQEVMKSSWKLNLQLLLVIAVAFLLWGCGSGGGSSFDSPTVTQTATPLIDAETLKGWVDAGLVNDGGFENVVILQTGSQAEYDAEHIPGAFLWDSFTQSGRLEGLAYDVKVMVPDGPTMDAMLARTGIDSETTIVISYASTSRIYNPTRAYFTLRYWGFPKDKIKVLNGGNNGWTDAAYALTTETTPEIASTFCVTDNDDLYDDLRYSIGELIQVVDANNASIAAAEGPLYNIVQQTTGDRVITNAIGRNWADFAQGGAVTGGYFIDSEAAEAVLLDADGPADDLTLGEFVPGLPSITHCVSGMSCTPIFFAMDALLGWDVAVYDGSKSQWDLYRGDPAGGDTTIGDAWNVNYLGRSNDISGGDADSVNAQLNFLYQSNDDPDANQIETEDAAYLNRFDGTSNSGTSGAPSSGSSDPSGC